MARPVVLAAVSLAAVLAVPSPAGAAGDRGCQTKERTVARGAQLVVYLGPKDVDDRRSLCARYRRRAPYVLSWTSLDAGPITSGHERPRVAGRYVFLIEEHYDRGTGDHFRYATLFDVARRRVRHQWRFGSFSDPGRPGIAFPRIRLLRSGTVGFSVSDVLSEVQPGGYEDRILRMFRATTVDTLAAGPEVDAASLRFESERMLWLEGGAERSADFF